MVHTDCVSEIKAPENGKLDHVSGEVNTLFLVRYKSHPYLPLLVVVYEVYSFTNTHGPNFIGLKVVLTIAEKLR